MMLKKVVLACFGIVLIHFGSSKGPKSLDHWTKWVQKGVTPRFPHSGFQWMTFMAVLRVIAEVNAEGDDHF